MNQTGETLLLRIPLQETLDATHSKGEGKAHLAPQSDMPRFENDGIRCGARFGRSTCVHYGVEGNFRREEGTVMMWFKPDWPADYSDTLGRILWDLRIEHGSVVEDDPSQRWALVYPNPTAEKNGRGAETVRRWRFCVSTNRNRYIIGTDQKRSDRRTRQAVWGTQQSFPANQWMHLAVTWTSHTGAIYVNGQLDNSSYLDEGVPNRPMPDYMQLGAIESWINAGPCGVLSDVQIHGQKLDENEIRALIPRMIH